MHLEKPSLAKRIQDPTNRGYDVLRKIFFTASPSSQAAGEAFIRRLSQRKDDLDPVSGPKVAGAQIAAFREWEQFKGERFAELRAIRHPALVVNGVGDEIDPRLELLPTRREPAERGHADVPRRRTRLSVPVPGVLHATRGRVPRLRRRVGRLLRRSPREEETTMKTIAPVPPASSGSETSRSTASGYGAMRLTGPGIWGPPPDRSAALATLRLLPETRRQLHRHGRQLRTRCVRGTDPRGASPLSRVC